MWVEELLDEKVKELYIKVAFINIVYVTWNNYRLKSGEKKVYGAHFVETLSVVGDEKGNR